MVRKDIISTPDADKVGATSLGHFIELWKAISPCARPLVNITVIVPAIPLAGGLERLQVMVLPTSIPATVTVWTLPSSKSKAVLELTLPTAWTVSA